MVETKQSMDSYLATLSNIVTEVEKVYQLQSGTADSIRYVDMSMKELMIVLNTRVATLDKEEITSMNASAGRALVPLSYTRDRLDYYNKKRLDYSRYPGMLEVSSVLLKFTHVETVNEDSLRNINMIIEVLTEIDSRYMNFRGGLGYRYLRIFVVLAVFGNYFNAAIVARFILYQFVVKGDS